MGKYNKLSILGYMGMHLAICNNIAIRNAQQSVNPATRNKKLQPVRKSLGFKK